MSGKTFYNNDLDNKFTGTMPNNGSVNKTIKAGESYTIPIGYHSGEGIINAVGAENQNIPDGYRLVSGSKACNGNFDGSIPVFAWAIVGGAQWTNFPSTAYFTDNLGKTWITCSVPANNGGVSNEGYIDVLGMYGNDWNKLKQLKSYSCTGSQAPSGACTLRVWLEKV